MILETLFEESVNGVIIGGSVMCGQIYSLKTGNSFKGYIYGESVESLQTQANGLIDQEKASCGDCLFKEIYPLGFELRVF
ncbi:hypothetical protein Lepto7375DRAFT_7424 [Leptolyngbya sp. PCC 7375]|nr:hypothetical protein Lepto7375DRAFT_0610 [Leptolyngbya sp. PCC 7375]EKU98163.1 hypothetical protein Lepto7375DRAFT_7424 [Leptolyngbya sp. PCC 7375]